MSVLPDGTLVTTEGPTRTRRRPPRATVLRAALRVVPPVSLGQCVMARVHHYRVTMSTSGPEHPWGLACVTPAPGTALSISVPHLLAPRPLARPWSACLRAPDAQNQKA